jgi:hypothetical protein
MLDICSCIPLSTLPTCLFLCAWQGGSECICSGKLGRPEHGLGLLHEVRLCLLGKPGAMHVIGLVRDSEGIHNPGYEFIFWLLMVDGS